MAARLGIAALNLLWPGLGLLRLGEGRRAARFIGFPFLLLFPVVAWYAIGPELTFASWAALTLLVVIGYIGAILLSAAICWRRSAERRPPERWWSRWYGILAMGLAALGATLLLPDRGVFYRAFYIPAEAMEPTFVRGDRFVARMSNLGPLRRGQIVLAVAPRGGIYVERIAALPGDRIAIEGGTVVLNGTPVAQRRVGAAGGPGRARLLVERFPGEAGEHRILDSGATMVDDFPETLVRPGHVFLLGDNRDHSADSRVPVDQFGLDQVPIANIVGRALFFSWWPGQRNAGRSIGD
jgi:signal peptidase I